MEIVITTPEQIAVLAAAAIQRVVEQNDEPVLGVATGSSPVRIYKELIGRAQAGQISFDNTSFFMLDEYIGLPAGHPQSYRVFLRQRLFDPIETPDDRVHGPDVYAADLAQACADYEAAIVEAGGIDLQLLGIGSDGHIGFNEPGSSLQSLTRIKTLTDSTATDNSRFFDSIDDVPRHVITQGLGTIRRAAHVILIATGASKARAVADAFEGPVSATCPASVLQFHPHVTVLVDDAAAEDLTSGEYYRSTFETKPAWQSTI